MKPVSLIIVFLLPAYLLVSCSTVLYTNVGQNTPLFHHKGETAISGSLGFTERTSGFAVMAGHSLSDKAALIGSYYNMNLGSGTAGGSINYVELGGGGYGYDEGNHMAWEVFGGLGYSSIESRWVDFSGSGTTSPGGSVNTTYVKPFIQPSIGISGKVGELAFTPRLAFIGYNSHTNTLLDAQANSSVEDFFRNNASTFVFEPGITLRLGFKDFKIQAQFNYSTFPSALPYPYSLFEYADKTFFSLGFHYVFPSRWNN